MGTAKPSVIKLRYEFVFREDKPDLIGLKMIGERGTVWFSAPKLKKTISKLKQDVAFYEEALQLQLLVGEKAKEKENEMV